MGKCMECKSDIVAHKRVIKMPHNEKCYMHCLCYERYSKSKLKEDSNDRTNCLMTQEQMQSKWPWWAQQIEDEIDAEQLRKASKLKIPVDIPGFSLPELPTAARKVSKKDSKPQIKSLPEAPAAPKTVAEKIDFYEAFTRHRNQRDLMSEKRKCFTETFHNPKRFGEQKQNVMS